jgi:GMP synthase (glutamine-hydrolysing)
LRTRTTHPLITLVTGEAVAPVRQVRGDFADWIEESVGLAWTGPWKTLDVRTRAPLPAVTDAAAFVLTGSASSVTERAPWMLRTEEYIRNIVRAGVPMLGICFGHQLIAQALGGAVERNPRGRELGTVTLEQTAAARADALFAGLPRSFLVNSSHLDSVVRLPDGAKILAMTALEPIAAFSVGERTWGVQFHPEFDGEIVRGYVRARSKVMFDEGLLPDHALAHAADSPYGREVLRSFVKSSIRLPRLPILV